MQYIYKILLLKNILSWEQLHDAFREHRGLGTRDDASLQNSYMKTVCILL